MIVLTRTRTRWIQEFLGVVCFNIYPRLCLPGCTMSGGLSPYRREKLGTGTTRRPVCSSSWSEPKESESSRRLKSRPMILLSRPARVRHFAAISELLIVSLDRIKRTKEAEQKARGDIEKFKAELAAEFAKFTASVSLVFTDVFVVILSLQAGGDSEATFAKLRTTTEKSIVELQASAQKNKDKVTQQLLKYVGEVHTEVHPNILVAQKLGLLK